MNAELIRLLIGLVISITLLIVLNRYVKLHAFFCLIISSITLGIITGIPVAKTIDAMQSGFGSLLGQIGFIVALGSCLGIILEKTGAMHAIAHKMLHLFGARRSTFTLSILGLIVGIPVFCDSGFIILSRLIPTIAAQSNIPSSSLTLALSSGLYTTHSLVPPTPGPLAAAVNMGLAENIGTVILVGMVGSLAVGLTGYFFAQRFGPRFTTASERTPEKVIHSDVDTSSAFLPLLAPIALISLGTFPKVFDWSGTGANILTLSGQPSIALAIGILLTIPLLKKHPQHWPDWISTALMDAGIILLITGAGGAFGNVIKQSGLESILKSSFSLYEVGGVLFIVLAFFIAALLKTAQGSTTSAMIITTSLVAPLTVAAGFSSTVQLSTIVLAVGAGGMCVSHANDSYFWVVSQFGGVAPADALRNFTRTTFYQGLAGLFTSIILFLLW